MWCSLNEDSFNRRSRKVPSSSYRWHLLPQALIALQKKMRVGPAGRHHRQWPEYAARVPYFVIVGCRGRLASHSQEQKRSIYALSARPCLVRNKPRFASMSWILDGKRNSIPIVCDFNWKWAVNVCGRHLNDGGGSEIEHFSSWCIWKPVRHRHVTWLYTIELQTTTIW